MTIDPEVSISSSTPFALIDHESAIPSEQEILFSIHTVFRIENIQQMKEKKGIYEVQLTLTDDNDPQLTGFTQRMREELTSSAVFQGVKQLYMELLKNTSNESDGRHNEYKTKLVKEG